MDTCNNLLITDSRQPIKSLAKPAALISCRNPHGTNGQTYQGNEKFCEEAYTKVTKDAIF